MLCWQTSDHTDIFINQQIKCYLDSTINLRPLTPHIVMLYPQNDDRIVAIDSVTSLYPMYCPVCTVCGKHHKTAECPSACLSHRSAAAAVASEFAAEDGRGQQISIGTLVRVDAAPRHPGRAHFGPTASSSNILPYRCILIVSVTPSACYRPILFTVHCILFRLRLLLLYLYICVMVCSFLMLPLCQC